MALSFIATPPKIHPAYNPHVYYIDSTNKNQPSFRYIVEIYNASTVVKLAELEIAPRPGDGYGYIDVSKIIQSQVLNALQLANTTWYNADNSAVYAYDIKFGETFTVAWPFDDYQFNSTPLYGGLTDLTNFSFVPHGFSVGSQILNTLTTIYGTVQDAINGNYTVVAIPNPYTITISLNFPGSAPLTPGFTTYATGTGPRLLNLINDLNVKAWNRAYTFEDYITYNTNQILPSSGNARIQNNAPVDYKVFDWQHLHWNFYDNNTNRVDQIRFTDDSGGVFTKSSSGVALMKAVPCGPANAGVLTPIGPAVLPLVKPTTLYYDVVGYDTAVGAASTLSKRVYIDRRCPINETQVLFMDRAGSWSSFGLTLRQTERIAVTRKDYRKELGDLGGGISPTQWGYESYDAGLTSFEVDFDTAYTLGTDYMSESMGAYFAELITSPEVYIQFDSSGTWRRIMITDNAYEIQSAKNKKLIRANLNVRLAIDDQVNI
jgi:hypothetical protein